LIEFDEKDKESDKNGDYHNINGTDVSTDVSINFGSVHPAASMFDDQKMSAIKR
jgi:hypothetical protein